MLKINKVLFLLILLFLSLILFKIRLKRPYKNRIFLCLIFVLIMQVFLLRIILGDFYIYNIKKYYVEEAKKVGEQVKETDNIDKKVYKRLEPNNVKNSVRGLKEISGLKNKFIRSRIQIKSISRYEDIRNIEAGIFKFSIDNKIYAGELRVGDILTVVGKVKDIKPASNEGELSHVNRLKSRGIYYKLKVKYIKKQEEDKVANLFGKIHEYFINNLNKNIKDEKELGFVRAITLGDKSLLDKGMSETYSRHGISHILAISGLHISLIGIFIYKILRKKLKFSFFISAAAASLILLLYQKILIRSVSADRAIAMLLTVFVAENEGRNYDLLNSMGLIGSVILFINPYELFNTGFILSFLAVSSIGLGSEYLIKPLKKAKVKFIKYSLIKNILMSFFIQLMSIPILAFNFFYIPFYAPILNLVVIPIFGIVCISAFILILPNMPLISEAALGNIHYISGLYEFLCKKIELLPSYRYLLGRPGIFQIILYYIAVCIFLFFMRFYKNIKKCIFRLLILFIPFTFIFILFPIKNTKTEFVFLDVGQGDGIYIQALGMHILVDSGSTSRQDTGKNIIKPFLLGRGIDKLDKVFITHADADHYNGILYLIKEDEDIKIDELILPFIAKEDEDYDKIIKAAVDKNIKISYIKAGDVIQNEKAGFICLSPDIGTDLDNTNRQSIVLLYKEKEFKALLCADADVNNEELILKKFKDESFIKEVSLLKTGHHGSVTSTGEKFISHLRPLYAIISYGEDNRYGHPSKEVLNNLEKYYVKTFKTADSGEIRVLTDGNNIEIKTFKK